MSRFVRVSGVAVFSVDRFVAAEEKPALASPKPDEDGVPTDLLVWLEGQTHPLRLPNLTLEDFHQALDAADG